MIKKIEDMTLEDIESMTFLSKKEIKELNFAELCMYQQYLNKIKARYNELRLKKDK